jgi:N utilization substance protein B
MAAQAKRTKARERAVQALYQIDVAATDLDEALQRFWKSFEPVEREVMDMAEALVRGVARKRREIDDAIEGVSTHWRLDRMARVDRNILRLAVHELQDRPEVPVKVVINEAIELGKKYGSESSGAFINGVLDKIASGLPPARRAEGGSDGQE